MSTETLKPVADLPQVEETTLPQPDNTPEPDNLPEYDKELAMGLLDDLESGVFLKDPKVVVNNHMNRIHNRDQKRDPTIIEDAVKKAVAKANENNIYVVEKKEDEEDARRQKEQDEKNTS